MHRALRHFLLLPLLAWSVAHAAVHDFDQGTFDRLQHDGRPVLVMVHASWCSTCANQRIVLSGLLQQPRLQSIQALRVDYDKQEDVARHLGVKDRSTLIVFRKGHEVGRSTGDMSREGIAALLEKAVSNAP